MKISTILDHIDSGFMALPEFQRGYVWSRDQVRGLFQSLYRRYPVGGLLVWTTESSAAEHRGGSPLPAGVVKLLLDGQQRMTSLYGVARGKAPLFFDGDARAFTGLYFHLEREVFAFYQPLRMADDPLWIDVSELMTGGVHRIGDHIKRLVGLPECAARVGDYSARLSHLLGIADIELHIDDVTGADKSLDVVVDIFKRVNSGGTKLSQGDLALAKICASWPEARNEMKAQLAAWWESDYDFDLDWLLRSVNTVLTGEAKFRHLHNKGADEIRDGLNRATKAIDSVLNLIAGRCGLDRDRVLFGRYAIPVMARYFDQHQGPLDERERDLLLFWYLQAAMWGRFSGSTETAIDKALEAIATPEGALDRLLEQLRLWHGTLLVEPAHFRAWSLGARFYPVLYMLTRMGEAKDWCEGIPLKATLLGRRSRLEVHHIFPKAQLYKHDYDRTEVNALANFCLLTKACNLRISSRLPEEYFPEVESNHPGALASQWIPMDRDLWRIENYPRFLEARRKLLADETNRRLEEFLHGDTRWLRSRAVAPPSDEAAPVPVIGSISSDQEEAELEALNKWVVERGLHAGTLSYELADEATGEQKAVLDLVWPMGVQTELSQPVAVLLNEGEAVIALASSAGYRCFTSPDAFRHYIEREILFETDQASPSDPPQ